MNDPTTARHCRRPVRRYGSGDGGVYAIVDNKSKKGGYMEMKRVKTEFVGLQPEKQGAYYVKRVGWYYEEDGNLVHQVKIVDKEDCDYRIDYTEVG